MVILNYFKQVYAGWGYLYQASGEIIKEQLFFDPLQDAGIETAFEKGIQAGHSAREINLAKCCSDGFIQHWKVHLIQKSIVTVIFPFVYPLLNSSYVSNIPGKSIITEPAAFFGVNPLEGLYSIDAMPKALFGENNTISNAANYIAFREDYHIDRAKDDKFNEFVTAYKNYMEFWDSLGHARTELTTLYNNRYLSSMPYKAYVYFKGKAYLYSNTIAEEAENDRKIEFYKLSLQKQESTGEEIDTAHIHENEVCPADKKISWIDWLYKNKWKIAEEIATPIIFKKAYSTVMSYFKAKDIKPEDSYEMDTRPSSGEDISHDPHDDDAPDTSIFWGILDIFDPKQASIMALIRWQSDDEILEQVAIEALSHTTVRTNSLDMAEDEEVAALMTFSTSLGHERKNTRKTQTPLAKAQASPIEDEEVINAIVVHIEDGLSTDHSIMDSVDGFSKATEFESSPHRDRSSSTPAFLILEEVDNSEEKNPDASQLSDAEEDLTTSSTNNSGELEISTAIPIEERSLPRKKAESTAKKTPTFCLDAVAYLKDLAGEAVFGHQHNSNCAHSKYIGDSLNSELDDLGYGGDLSNSEWS